MPACCRSPSPWRAASSLALRSTKPACIVCPSSGTSSSSPPASCSRRVRRCMFEYLVELPLRACPHRCSWPPPRCQQSLSLPCTPGVPGCSPASMPSAKSCVVSHICYNTVRNVRSAPHAVPSPRRLACHSPGRMHSGHRHGGGGQLPRHGTLFSLHSHDLPCARIGACV